MKKQRILMIDNYDSFTYNLVQYLGELNQELIVHRNDQVSLKEVERLKPDRIVISPGPGSPKDAGISMEVIRQMAPRVPILGVCLGHQCIAAAFGGTVERNWRLMHGKTSAIEHNRKGIFKGLPNPFEATRYHSLVVRKSDFPKELQVTAQTKSHEIMGLEHKTYPLHGVQFHPESILTQAGMQLLKNFLKVR